MTLAGPASISAAAGQLTLNGGVNLAGNVLTIGGAGITNVAAPGLSGNGTLAINFGTTVNLSGGVSAATSLIDNGTLNMSAASETIANLNDSGAGTGILTLNNTALTVTGTGAFSGSISGGGSLTVSGGSLAVSGNTSLPSVTVTGSAGSLTNTAGTLAAASLVVGGPSSARRRNPKCERRNRAGTKPRSPSATDHQQSTSMVEPCKLRDGAGPTAPSSI